MRGGEGLDMKEGGNSRASTWEERAELRFEGQSF